MASVRRLLSPVKVALGAGVVLLVVGLGMVALEAQGRVTAADNAVTFSAEERVRLGDEGEGFLDYLRMTALTRSMMTGSDVATYEVRTIDNGDAEDGFSIDEKSQRVLVAPDRGWHVAPTTIPVFAGLALIVSALFMCAARWHRRVIERE